MQDEIQVKVIRYPDRPALMLAYTDPVSGKRKCRSARTDNEKDAWKAAAAWEEELRAGPHCPPSRVTWKDFRQRYEEEKLASLAPGSLTAAVSSLNCLERVLNPDRLCKLTATVMSDFQAKLRKEGAKETTIAKHLRHIKAALNWGVKIGLLAKRPAIEMPKRAKGQTLMKGRPITAEEFDRMLAAVPKVRPHDAPAWTRYLTGLWLSGLRLGESLALSWDLDAPFSVDLAGRHPRFRILGEAQKSGRDQLLPMTPDFARFLLETPEAARQGPVFDLAKLHRKALDTVRVVGKVVSAIGEKAGVVVDKAAGKYASAHDLRRAFGTRWSTRVKTPVLQKLMRHASIQTTMGYYVDLDADDLAASLWATEEAGNISGNIGPFPGKVDRRKSMAEAGIEPARGLRPTGF